LEDRSRRVLWALATSDDAWDTSREPRVDARGLLAGPFNVVWLHGLHPRLRQAFDWSINEAQTHPERRRVVLLSKQYGVHVCHVGIRIPASRSFSTAHDAHVAQHGTRELASCRLSAVHPSTTTTLLLTCPKETRPWTRASRANGTVRRQIAASWQMGLCLSVSLNRGT
jgi:hypothetical protein